MQGSIIWQQKFQRITIGNYFQRRVKAVASFSSFPSSHFIPVSQTMSIVNHSLRQKGKKVYSKRTASTVSLSIADTSLGSNPDAAALLDGLDIYKVPSLVDSHPLTVYGIQSQNVVAHRHCDDHNGTAARRPILLLHGRTWSSVPVYHFLGGPKHKASQQEESRSLIEAFFDTHELQPYAMDFRSFGGTPADETGQVTPHTCVGDVESVLQWISARHGLQWLLEKHPNDDDSNDSDSQASTKTCEKCEMPVLLGWSQGALIAQLVAQKNPSLLSKVVLYGSIYDPMVRYPRAPLYASSSFSQLDYLEEDGEKERLKNSYDGAIEDFTIEGSIPPDPARRFAQAALLCDPYKAKWTSLHEFNNVDPARVHVPTLVVAGDQDPYCPLRAQQELFCNLGRGADRCWSILSGADHAVHLLDGRERFVQIVASFVENGRRDTLYGF